MRHHGTFRGLPGVGDKVSWLETSNCEVNTQAMPPSFSGFASRGVVLPAGRGQRFLPVATVNVPGDVPRGPGPRAGIVETVLGIGRSLRAHQKVTGLQAEDNWHG